MPHPVSQSVPHMTFTAVPNPSGPQTRCVDHTQVLNPAFTHNRGPRTLRLQRCRHRPPSQATCRGSGCLDRTILCSWLVCKRPRSPRLVFHTMSSLPMTVTPLMTPAFSANSGLGFRQYRYCRVSMGCRYDIFPNVDSLQRRRKTNQTLSI